MAQRAKRYTYEVRVDVDGGVEFWTLEDNEPFAQVDFIEWLLNLNALIGLLCQNALDSAVVESAEDEES